MSLDHDSSTLNASLDPLLKSPLKRSDWQESLDKVFVCCPQQLVVGSLCNTAGSVLIALWWQITFGLLTAGSATWSFVLAWLSIEWLIFWKCYPLRKNSSSEVCRATDVVWGENSRTKYDSVLERPGWWQRPLLRLVAIIAFAQVFLWIYSPCLMVLPMGLKSALDIQHPFESDLLCDDPQVGEQLLDMALNFARDPETGELPWDESKVTVSIGGLVYRFPNEVRGYVPAGNCVYIAPRPRCDLNCAIKGECIQPEIILHEHVHIWQVQNRHPPMSSFWAALASQIQFSNPYLYGGGVGLAEARESGMGVLEFGFEVQATLVEEYYRIMRNDSESAREGPYISPDTPDGRWVDDVEYYALQILGGSPRANVTRWKEERGCFTLGGCREG